MPAFDPVRDAVLNSPLTPSQPLPSPSPRSYPRTEFPSQNRRATDLSVLLNSHSQEPSLSSPPPPPSTRSSTLSHLLHSDPEHDALADSEPLYRRSTVRSSGLDLSHSSPHVAVRTTSRSSTGSPLSSPSAAPPPPGSNSPASLISPPLGVVFPHSSPSLSNTPSMLPPASRIPYNPTRITPAGSVLIPMSPDEMERYKNYLGIGTQILSKRKRDEPEDGPERPPGKKFIGDVGVVVGHYNSRPDVGVIQRLESPIIGLKMFNNWVKSVLITRFAHPALTDATTAVAAAANSSNRARARRWTGKVLDMGCGKGGDLPKWLKARVKEFMGVDIATVSVEQARSRWERLREPRFNARFETLDCYSEPLSKAFPPGLLEEPFDVVSMQFCMHYAFETQQKAECMLENVSKWLRPGGVFIGTIPNSEQLLGRLDELPPDTKELSFGNTVYKVRFEDRENRPTFGHRYWFFLKDAVEDVPEYIVQWDNFVRMAEEFDLFQIYKDEFHHVYKQNQKHPEFGPLMVQMKVVDANGESSMDEEQWEAANLYIAFAFEKR